MMGATMEIAIYHIQGRRNPPAKHRIEVGRLPVDRRCPIQVVVTEFYRDDPEDDWRVVLNWCYPADGAVTAVEEACKLVNGYRAKGEPCEDNLDQVEISVPICRDEVVEEVCGDRRPAA